MLTPELYTILCECEVLENVCALECKNFKAHVYNEIYKAELIVGLDNRVSIMICVPELWQQNLIDIYVQNYEKMILLPHIERDGKVCLFELEGVLIDHNLEGILIQSVMRTKTILEDGFLGKNADDFIEEFDAYWAKLPDCRGAYFIVPKEEYSQPIKCAIKNIVQKKKEKQAKYIKREKESIIYMGKDAECLKRWDLKKTSIVNAVYFVVSPADKILPPDFRQKVGIEYFNMLLNMIPQKEVSNLMQGLGAKKIIVFGIKQPNGYVNHVAFLLIGGSLMMTNDAYIMQNVSQIQPLAIVRTDKEYLMSRTIDNKSNSPQKKILVIGCGSIGGYLINELAKLGYEDITIVDNDKLTDENIFRHVLGMEYVSQYKCVALGQYIRKNIPEVIIKTLSEKFEDAVLEEDLELTDYDMIISATGNHNLNRWINSYVQKNELDIPIIYAWNEVYGIGNHVAYFKHGQVGCFECLFGRDEETGELYDKSAYCEKNQKIIQSYGGCGKAYVPYGNTVSLKTVIMCLELMKDVFDNVITENVLISSKGDDKYFVEKGLKVSNRYLCQKQRVKNLYGSDFVNVKCGVCHDSNRNGE